MTVGRSYVESLLDYDISAWDKDVLIIHGDADAIVPLSYSQHAADVYASAELEIIPGAGHGFAGDDEILAGDLMARYRHLGDRDATAVHNILYTAVNSWRYAAGEPADPMPVWRIVLIVADTALGVTLDGLEVIAVRRFLKRRSAAKAGTAEA